MSLRLENATRTGRRYDTAATHSTPVPMPHVDDPRIRYRNVDSTDGTGPEKQPMLRLGFLKPVGTFTHQAGLELQRRPQYENTVLIGETSLNAVFRAVATGNTKFAVVPIENSSDGKVNDTHRNLFNQDDDQDGFRIVSELVMPIEQVLYYQSRKKIQVLASKRSAIGQCDEKIKKEFGKIKRIYLDSTAQAVALAAEYPEIAALGSPIAADAQKLEGLTAIPSFNDKKSNATTFVVVQKGGENPPPTGNDKTTFIMTIPDTEGSLVHALDVLAEKGVDLNKIKSASKTGDSVSFLVSADGHEDEENGMIKGALDSLIVEGVGVKRLGSYPKSDLKEIESEGSHDVQGAIKRIQEEAENGDAMDETKKILVFTLKDHPGALRDALRPFAEAGVNLTKIDSQPSGIHNEHIFYLAFDKETRRPRRLIKKLAEQCHYTAELRRARRPKTKLGRMIQLRHGTRIIDYKK